MPVFCQFLAQDDLQGRQRCLRNRNYNNLNRLKSEIPTHSYFYKLYPSGKVFYAGSVVDFQKSCNLTGIWMLCQQHKFMNCYPSQVEIFSSGAYQIQRNWMVWLVNHFNLFYIMVTLLHLGSDAGILNALITFVYNRT